MTLRQVRMELNEIDFQLLSTAIQTGRHGMTYAQETEANALHDRREELERAYPQARQLPPQPKD